MRREIKRYETFFCKFKIRIKVFLVINSLASLSLAPVLPPGISKIV